VDHGGQRPDRYRRVVDRDASDVTRRAWADGEAGEAGGIDFRLVLAITRMKIPEDDLGVMTEAARPPAGE
jgi:hypothetical protein